MTANWQGLRLDPLDVLFCRDGRPFDAAARVVGGLPNPQTLAGALRTALLARTAFNFREFAEARKRQDIHSALKTSGAPDWVVGACFRGPWLGLVRNGKSIEPLLAQPATLSLKDGGGWLRAEPRDPNDLPGWETKKEKERRENNNEPREPDDQPKEEDKPSLLPLWRKGKPDTKSGSGFLTLTGLRAFLKHEDFADEEFFKTRELYDFDNRTGIGIDMQTLTSGDGEIYGIRLLSLKPKISERSKIKDDPYRGAEVCLYAEILPGIGAPDLKPYLAEPVPLGGEEKYVSVKPDSGCTWPVSDPNRTTSLWYLASPAFFTLETAPIPRFHQGLTLKAAASGAGMAVSGWDVARNGPRPTRFAVPAGAVYFVKGTATAEGPFVLDADAATEGWGFALQGHWSEGSNCE